ncbi:aldo/keto reductase [Fulvivirga maritima]|uniref:aldo/keto reductase n=1 Tax=Fulvivirga maritima TaxID=2904247 RepID=UPI0027959642|nr:aldo/keto reductase [Fulvivirga maritima]
MNTLAFKNGDQMPALGLGTWKSEPGKVKMAVYEAIKTGYRHIDCAPIYGNEPEVGAGIKQAIEEGIISRNELWVTSKLWNDSHRKEDVIPALESSLSDLKLQYVDLYLIHWPVALKKGTEYPTSSDDFF